jgi:hypothetical protein
VTTEFGEIAKKVDGERIEESPVLVLPEDPVRLTQLWLKREEYEMKHQRERENRPRTLPEEIAYWHHIRIMERLWEEGEVRAWDYCGEMVKRGYGRQLSVITNALAVIHDYIETGGEKVQGGAGLPKFWEWGEGQ